MHTAQPPDVCHRHLILIERVTAIATVPIDVGAFVTTVPLCQACLKDTDSWLRLFGLRDLDEPDIREEWMADGILLTLDAVPR